MVTLGGEARTSLEFDKIIKGYIPVSYPSKSHVDFIGITHEGFKPHSCLGFP